MVRSVAIDAAADNLVPTPHECFRRLTREPHPSFVTSFIGCVSESRASQHQETNNNHSSLFHA
jgi:hypothetical protein